MFFILGRMKQNILLMLGVSVRPDEGVGVHLLAKLGGEFPLAVEQAGASLALGHP